MSEVIRKAFAFLAPDHPTVRAALEEIEQLQKDAERYRWLRERYTGFDFDWMPDEDGNHGKQVICFEMTPGMRIGRDIDAAIDDALTPPTPPALEAEERDTRTIDMFASQAS